MNTCAFHPDVAAAAYCRTCGKALCTSCVRGVRGVVYCEDCLAHRLQDTMPPAATVIPGMPNTMPAAPAGAIATQPGAAVSTGVPVMVPAGGPNPAVAAILAVFFPFGVAPVYAGQYAKGLTHMAIFAFLVWGLSSGAGNLEPVLGLGMAFFYFYQIVDSYRTARAVQLNQPVPDPFGLSQTLTGGEKIDVARIPVGAMVLIGLGVLFLLNSMGIRFGWAHHLWPLVLIVLGVWMFIRRTQGGYR